MKHWYAVYTQPRKETAAREHLERQGFEVFLPRYLRRRSHARRTDTVPAPLFPRYIFVAFDAEESGWRVIRSTRGVIDLVRNGLTPVPVPESIIEGIKHRQDEDGYVVLGRYVKFDRGTPIKIGAGPFANYEAIFEAQRDEDRVVALLSLLGRKVVVELPIKSIVLMN